MVLLLGLLFAFALPAAAAPPALPKPLAEMVDRARNVPAEFGADSLLRIAEAPAASDKELKASLIEEAFRMAGAAQEPLKRRGIRTAAVNSRPSFLARAYAQDLDSLTLQSRAVMDMLRVDKVKARALFAAIAPPAVARLSCGDTLVYDVSSYYDALAEIARGAFTPKEMAEEEHVKLLAAAAGRIASAAEVGPMAKALAAAQVTPDQMQMLVTGFSSALKNLSADDRSFSFTVGRDGTALSGVEALAAAARAKQVSTIALIDAMRTYLAHQLSARRCWDTGGPTVAISAGGADPAPPQPDVAAQFNDGLRKQVFPPESQIAPLAGDEVRAAGIDMPDSKEAPPESADVKQLADQYKALLFDPTGAPWPEEAKGQTEWQAKLREYLAGLSAWKDDSDDFFFRKSALLGGLSNVVPNGPMRELVLHAYLQFLEQNGYSRGSRIEWFLPVNTLLARVMFDPALGSIAEEMRNSGNGVIALYAQLDRLLPRQPGKLMQLM